MVWCTRKSFFDVVVTRIVRLDRLIQTDRYVTGTPKSQKIRRTRGDRIYMLSNLQSGSGAHVKRITTYPGIRR